MPILVHATENNIYIVPVRVYLHETYKITSKNRKASTEKLCNFCTKFALDYFIIILKCEYYLFLKFSYPC